MLFTIKWPDLILWPLQHCNLTLYLLYHTTVRIVLNQTALPPLSSCLLFSNFPRVVAMAVPSANSNNPPSKAAALAAPAAGEARFFANAVVSSVGSFLCQLSVHEHCCLFINFLYMNILRFATDIQLLPAHYIHTGLVVSQHHRPLRTTYTEYWISTPSSRPCRDTAYLIRQRACHY